MTTTLDTRPYPSLDDPQMPATIAWTRNRAASVLMHYGLLKVEIGFVKAKSFAGDYRFVPGWDKVTYRNHERIIERIPPRGLLRISSLYVAGSNRVQVDDTIRHETAHAIVGPGHGHDPVWFGQYRAMGGQGGVTDDRPRSEMGYSFKWSGTCGHPAQPCAFNRDRMTARANRLVCRKHRMPIAWTANA